MSTYQDYSLEECAEAAEKLIQERHAEVYQKFTCAGCGSRQTMPDANVFYTSGRCEECGHVTDIKAQGCNYVVKFSLTQVPDDKIRFDH